MPLDPLLSLKNKKEDVMERHDQEIVDMDPRTLIRINSAIELKFFLMALLYQHKVGNIDAEA